VCWCRRADLNDLRVANQALGGITTLTRRWELSSNAILGTMLEASPPGRRSPTFWDARALMAGGFPVRGWVWLLSMLWVGAGATYAGYAFYITTKPWPGPDLGIIGWSEIPMPIQIVIALATVVLCVALVPVPIAGIIRLRGWRRGNWLRTSAWAGTWIAGVALIYLAGSWVQYPLDTCHNPPGTAVLSQCPPGSPAVVSWGELPICAAWLVLGILMTWILAVPAARRSDVPSISRQAIGRAR
jgi:hypothetical protein